MARSKATCKCIDDINSQLEAKGHRLDLAFTVAGEVFPMLKTEPAPAKTGERFRRRRAPIVPATHCPFCGTAYVKGRPR